MTVTMTVTVTKKIMYNAPPLFLYYEESLVLSNLNSKLFWIHCVRPNLSTKSAQKG